MKRYKFQALVRLYTDSDDIPLMTVVSAPHRMVLRGRNDGSRRSQVFNALVSCDDDGPFRPGSGRVLVTLRLAGDHVTDARPGDQVAVTLTRGTHGLTVQVTLGELPGGCPGLASRCRPSPSGRHNKRIAAPPWPA